MKKLFILLITGALFIACEKPDTRPECEREEYGTVIVLNNTEHTVTVDIVDAYTRNVKVYESEQKEIHCRQTYGVGSNFFVTDKNEKVIKMGNIEVTQCENTVLVIP
jgi:hypothetical protein